MNTLRNRLENFVDAVLAIAVTLLAVELPIPNVINASGDTILQSIMPYAHELLAFILSFATIALFWVNHHRMTQHLTEHMPRRIVWMTMVFLLCQTLIPFATKSLILNEFNYVSTFLYALVLLGSSLTFSMLHYWTHQSRGNRTNTSRTLLGPVSYLGACMSAFLSPALSFVFLIIPVIYYFLPRPTPTTTRRI